MTKKNPALQSVPVSVELCNVLRDREAILAEKRLIEAARESAVKLAQDLDDQLHDYELKIVAVNAQVLTEMTRHLDSE